ncbi:TBC domain-containing protein kinase-like protein [Leptotrombidium deliense]|uniref:TBC domain-containing protein kinase-like protein n=1 Tax=Leptotrombidium deliense TaxID=299467 RepID=A0A443SD07_9ACAR|nr:TBC domain-containing protein kinase-like protein [Leptotrombidium deliense]
MDSRFKFEFASLTLKTAQNSWDSCGTNGLPITPSCVALVGNFKALVANCKHPNLVEYLDCRRSKHDKVTLIYEHYNDPVDGNDDLIIEQMLSALHFLHYTVYCVHGNITPESIIFDGKNYKLCHWPLNCITEYGKLLDATALLPKDLRFLSPERIISLNETPSRKSDVWSLVLVLLSLKFKNIEIPENPAELAFCRNVDEVMSLLKLESLPSKWELLVKGALQPRIRKRLNVKDLMSSLGYKVPKFSTSMLDSLISYDKLVSTDSSDNKPLDIGEAYHLWCLLTSSLAESSSKEKSNIPILNFPSLVILDNSNNSTANNDSSTKIAYIPQHCLLPTDNLKSRLCSVNPKIFFPLIVTPGFESNSKNSSEAAHLPLIIKESDFEYQCERIVLYKHIIGGVPFMRQKLLEEAKKDITPYYRSRIWASILEVKWSVLMSYERIDKVTPTSTDRQINVDIPRCHQYNDLLASPQGHQKLKRILKAWLSINEPNYVYWQGLDSLAAPFVVLNFDNEAMAFACFDAFIHKYLRGFFNKDNSPTIQEYLALFSHLIAFHDPLLFNHLRQLGFTPELYAIPWFLTMFTHVLPLHKIVHVWDTLLLGSEPFPLFIGLAILLQLRDQLLGYTFNDCILIFSDLPEIDIERCVKDAIRLFCATPKSATTRGLVRLSDLREDICPRIELSELVSLTSTINSKKLFVVDGRNKEEVLQKGEIRNAIKVENVKDISGHHLMVVVNDMQIASQLVNENINRVCIVIITHCVPKELIA